MSYIIKCSIGKSSIKIFRITLTLLYFCFFTSHISAAERNMVLNLAGAWKFSIGDDSEWMKDDFDDTSWESIKVPSAWEDQGFYGYDGYAWYRTSFFSNREMKNKDLFLSLGYIGDVDEVYLNGKLIGFSGSFPPEFSSALEAKRKYPIPENYIQPGKNVISVRVYNHQLGGGIVSGDIGIIAYSNTKPDISLFGLWNFKTGDNSLWKAPAFQDKHWKKIVVPGNWENQGYKDYDGIGWYRKQILISTEYNNQRMVLLIGKITNSDQVFVNGVLIGSTGEFPHSKEKPLNEDNSKKLRVYIIPDNILIINKMNTIAVRVYDKMDRGGISEGPVGLMRYVSYSRLIKELNEEVDN